MQLHHPRLVALLLTALAAAPLGLGLVQDRPAAEPPAPAAVRSEPLEPVTVFAVRHAEKATDDPRDPSLTEAGEARSKELARMLGAAGLTHLFSSPYERTQATLAPLARATELEVVVYDPRDPTDLLDQLRALPAGSRAVVSGHSNTTPAMVQALGGTVEGLTTHRGMEVMDESEYDRLFVLTLGDEGRKTSTVELRYGEPSAR